MTLVADILSGDRLALARCLTQVENDTPQGRAALDELFPHAGRAHLIGITGSSGAGKSTLVNQLALAYRRSAPRDKAPRVAIVAVDPSSPFSGGAILGDRVRMRDLAGDPGVFIRSMASRGSVGGLARATAAVTEVLDAAGYDIILIETVGAGQSEVDIARLAHTTIVIEAPGMGDDIQAIKAGILEIADILVVNKADRPGAENTVRALRNALELGHPAACAMQPKGHHAALESQTAESAAPAESELWLPPVLVTVASTGEGTAELVSAVQRHSEYLKRTDLWKERERARLQTALEDLVTAALVERWRETLADETYRQVVHRLLERKISPFEAVSGLVRDQKPRNRPD